MILKFYRGHDPGTILIIIITGLLVWFRPLLHPVSPEYFYDSSPMPLFNLLTQLLGDRPFAGTLVSFILVIITGLYLVNFNTRIFFINERTFLPAAIFIILTGFLPLIQTFNPVYPCLLLLLFAVDRIISSYRKQGIAYNFFDASMMIGVASLIYFNFIWFFVVVVAGIALLRTASLREFSLALIGLITPYIILIAWYYLAGKNIEEVAETILNNITGNSPAYLFSPVQVVLSLLNGLIIIVSLVHLWSVFNTKKVRSRKTFSLLIWVLVTSVISYLVVPAVSLEMITVFLVPASYILTHYMVFKRNKKIANVTFAILFISVLVLQLI